MKKISIFLLMFGGIINACFAQFEPTNRQRFVLELRRASNAITIDGNADEDDWKQATPTAPFLNKWPADTGVARVQTEVKMLYDENNLYITARSFQRREDVIIQTLKRDQMESFWSGDSFGIVVDPMNQQANGFFFGVNAAGSQLDAALNLMGSWTRANENWDNKWYSATTVHDDYWVAEIAIPFSSLRFKDGAKEWGLNFIRGDMKNNVFSTWARVPLQFNGIDLGSLGTLRWQEEFVPRKSKVTLIPYASSSYGRNFEEGGESKLAGNAGLDAKVAVSSSLNLDLTLRPDFSNVEVDRQMTNVTRFSLLFPERRNFFLENADLFTNFGSWQVMPFFSRKIGMQDGSLVPISAGARLSGNLTKGLRIGLMDIQTEATKDVSANNYFVTSLQQRVFSRSLFKFFGANRQTTKATEGDTQHDFNRTYGTEFQYVSKNGKTSAAVRAHAAQTPTRLANHAYYSATFSRITKKYYTGLMVERVGENYVNDFGFVPRLYNYDALRDTTVRIGHYNVNPWLGLTLYPKKSKVINMIEPNTWSIINYRENGEFLERNTSVNLSVLFKNTSQLYVESFQTAVRLPFASDILGNEKPIPVDRYNFTQFKVRYTTDSRRPVNGMVSLGRGSFYNGTRTEFGGALNVRRQPWGVFGVTYLQNRIELPGEYGSANFLLIGPRAEVSLRNNIWWTTFLQYNTQASNFNINSRFQWRYKPMSDFFIVYTDNYTETNFSVKNRGVVCKLTYWLNL